MPNTYQKKDPNKPLHSSNNHDRKEQPPGEQGNTIDPSIPLQKPKEEHFADLASSGSYGTDAWLIAINPRCKRVSAKQQASKLRGRKDVASRIAWLRSNKYGKNKPKRPTGGAAPREPDTPTPEAPRKPTEDTSPLTRAEINQVLASAVRNAESSTEKTQALKLAREMMSLDLEGSAVMSPESILEYITSTAGKTHAEIAGDLGGVRQMVEQVFTFAKVPPSVQKRVLTRMVNDLKATPEDTHTTDTQTGKHLLSDGQSDNSDEDSNSEPREDAGQVGGGGKTTPPV